jgi:hypothetical protein
MADTVILDADAMTALAEGRGTPEQATARLAQMTAEYQKANTPVPTSDRGAARAELDALGNDPNWRAAFFRGSPAARQQFSELAAKAAGGDETAAVLAGDIPSPEIEITGSAVGGRITTRAMAVEVGALRESGLNDDTIRQIVDGTPASAAEVAMARRYREMRMSDPAWTARYLKGRECANNCAQYQGKGGRSVAGPRYALDPLQAGRDQAQYRSDPCPNER